MASLSTLNKQRCFRWVHLPSATENRAVKSMLCSRFSQTNDVTSGASLIPMPRQSISQINSRFTWRIKSLFISCQWELVWGWLFHMTKACSSVQPNQMSSSLFWSYCIFIPVFFLLLLLLGSLYPRFLLAPAFFFLPFLSSERSSIYNRPCSAEVIHTAAEKETYENLIAKKLQYILRLSELSDMQREWRSRWKRSGADQGRQKKGQWRLWGIATTKCHCILQILTNCFSYFLVSNLSICEMHKCNVHGKLNLKENKI